MKNISDEQILAIVRKYFTNNCAGDVACARELIALAQEAAPEVSDYVPMPQNADQAQLMANAGIEWLRSNAPERLKTEVKAEPVQYRIRLRDTRYEGWSSWSECSKEAAEYYMQHPRIGHIARQVEALYRHPPTASDLVERIRALEIAEPMGWMDRCHNGVVAKIVELIEGAKCATQND
jgi:hypothetical protein